MPNVKKDRTISALEAVHAALKPLNSQERQRVIASVHVLLEISARVPPDEKADSASDTASGTAGGTPTSSTRPPAIRELIQAKKPRTHPQFIALFAYFREKYQSKPTFSRDDLRPYYTVSRENPPKNYDRDFVRAVMEGWIHEDGDSSYITSKGIEAVESGFAGTTQNEPRPRRSRTPKGKKGRLAKKGSR